MTIGAGFVPFTTYLYVCHVACILYEFRHAVRIGYYCADLPDRPAVAVPSLLWGSEFTQVWS
jgi:hypothetical protein